VRLDRFDVEAYLQDRDVPYLTQGKNVSKGWIEINCPFCGDDPSFHLGINLSSKRLHCWRCGHRGSALELIRGWERCSWNEAEEILKQYRAVVFEDQEKESENQTEERKRNLCLPSGIVEELPDRHRAFLEQKGFAQPDRIVSDYHLLACNELGEYKFRIIIPIYQNDLLVNYTGRAVIEWMTPKYKTCPNSEAITPLKQCVYNLHSTQDSALIVEGPLDVWKIGSGSVALMGMEWSLHQVAKIVNRGLRRIAVMFDGEQAANRKAHKLAHFLASFVSEVEVLEIEKGSPHDLSSGEVEEVRRELSL